MIYIDPPYNTGSKKIYNDNLSHEAWVAMMRERLVLAKPLLRNDGVIFISIDDNEQARLKLLCDEIFGDSLDHPFVVVLVVVIAATVFDTLGVVLLATYLPVFWAVLGSVVLVLGTVGMVYFGALVLLMVVFLTGLRRGFRHYSY